VIRALTQWDENPGLSDLAQTAVGRCMVWLVASALLFWHSERGPLSAGGTTLVIIAIAALPLVSAFPARKRWFLSIASVLTIIEFFLQRQLPELQLGDPRTWFFHAPDGRDIALLVSLALLGLYGFYLLLARFAELPRVVRRYPVIALHGAIWLALLCVPVFRAPSVVLEVLPVIAWRLSYLVQFAARGHLAGSGFAAHLFYLWPVYGPNGVPTPLGKGLEYLSRHEAVERGEFARSQLAGVKLLALAFVWEVLLRAMDIHVYGQSPEPTWSWLGTASVGLPRLRDMMDHDVNDAPTVVAGLYLELVRMSLLIAIYGHIPAAALNVHR
jgi:hypothetical protein